MSLFRASFFALAIALIAGCRRDEPAQNTQGASTSTQSSPATPSRFAATGWPDDAGPVLVLPGSAPGDVRLVLPELTDNTLADTSSFDLDVLPQSSVSLYSRNRKSTLATIAGGGSEEAPRGCKTWPTARLDSFPGDSWRFGLAANVAEDLPLPNWGPSLANDSTEATRAVVRIASGARNDSVFQGVPFTVRFLYRLELGDSRVIVADAVRRINTEANVREEHALIIAERAHDSAWYTAAYRETQMGREDEVRVPEIVGAVLLGENRRPALFISLEYSEGARLLLFERLGANRWVLRWRSAYSGC